MKEYFSELLLDAKELLLEEEFLAPELFLGQVLVGHEVGGRMVALQVRIVELHNNIF